jgi:hypothetical protein
MYPYIAQDLAASRARDLREQAAAARRAKLARRARRGRAPVAAGWPGAGQPRTPRFA